MKKISGILAIILLLLLSVPASGATAGVLSRYDPASEGILSQYYPVKDGYITGILPGTPTEKVCRTCVPAGAAAPGDIIATGTVITAGDKSLTAIVTGDLSGDGKVSITDVLMLKASILGTALSPAAGIAADLNYDGKVSITDLLKIKAIVLGQEQPVYAPGNRELLLLAPEATAHWQAGTGAVSFESQDTAIVTVDQAGTVTARQEGSAFLYALDSRGDVLDRRFVTVLSEPLSLSLPEQLGLVTGQQQTLTPAFNHPVSPAIAWSSSDGAVVTVEGGMLSAKAPGTATVTATAEGGVTAQVTVTVVPPVTKLDIERRLYKVKPGNTKVPLVLLEPAGSGEELQWASSDPSIATVSPEGVITGKKYGTVTVTATGKYSGKTDTCQVKVCNVQQVAITFDDGPGPRTDDLLDFLKENDMRVTFFLVGNRMNSYKEEVKREAAEGHEIGYHSYSHQIQTGLSSERITADFEKTDQILYELTGQHFTLWRTPGGGYNSRVLSAVPLPHIMWQEDTRDWETLNTYSVYRAIMRTANDGDIILLHDIHGTSVDGAMQAMRDLNAGDYEFVTVTELLSRKGTPPENGKTYFGDK